MGMYTGLRGWVMFKEQYHDDIRKLADGEAHWSDILLDLKGTRVREDWVSQMRCQFIPFGAVCYMPDDWNEEQPVNFSFGQLSFTCSLKDYGSEIEKFLNLIEVIADGWRLEELYEENEEPTIHRRKL